MGAGELLVCGTAAAEGWPALFCTCRACAGALRLGGRNRRTRSAYMLGERIRIDFGPDSHFHQHAYGLQYQRVQHLLVTHSHEDHWYPHDLFYRRDGFSVVEGPPLVVWGNERVRERFEHVNGDDWDRYRLEFRLARAWETLDLGEGVSAVGVPAAHNPGEECLNYRIAVGGRQLLLGHDTGWYPDEVWGRLGEAPLDLVLMDCTYGSQDHMGGHLGCAGVVRARDRMQAEGALAPGARFYATHFSHNGGWLYDDLCAYLEPRGIGVTYDGLRLEP